MSSTELVAAEAPRLRHGRSRWHRTTVSIVAGATVALGMVGIAGPADAGSVSCDRIVYGESAGDNAEADGCAHSGGSGERTRLVANQRFNPFNKFSPWASGSYTNRNFWTPSCDRGCNGAGFQHG